MIETLEQLDALPVKSVVLATTGEAFQKELLENGTGTYWRGTSGNSYKDSRFVALRGGLVLFPVDRQAVARAAFDAAYPLADRPLYDDPTVRQTWLEIADAAIGALGARP